MTRTADDGAEPTLRARKECAAWLAECMKIGWARISIDALEALWWEHHDNLGNLKAPANCDSKATSLEPGAPEQDAKKGSGEQAGSTPDETLRDLADTRTDEQLRDAWIEGVVNAVVGSCYLTSAAITQLRIILLDWLHFPPQEDCAPGASEPMREALDQIAYAVGDCEEWAVTNDPQVVVSMVKDYMWGVTASIDETLREALAEIARLDHCRPLLDARTIARRALATPTKPEMQSVHPAQSPSKEKP